MQNLEIYKQFAQPPETALRTIQAGKLKGFTDINPQWRIEALTALYGPCGIGWYTETVRQWLETGPDGRTAAFCNIRLFVKTGDEWSKPIEGTGGSMFVNIFRGSPESSDEAFKMAETDAISVACKKLGIAANIYYSQGRTKYTAAAADLVSEGELKTAESMVGMINDMQKQLGSESSYTLLDIIKGAFKDKAPKTPEELTKDQYGQVLAVLKKTVDARQRMINAKSAAEAEK